MILLCGDGTYAAAVTRTQGCKDAAFELLMTNDVPAQGSITKKETSRLQPESDSLQKCVDLKKAVKNSDFEVQYEKPWALLYRIQKSK